MKNLEKYCKLLRDFHQKRAAYYGIEHIGIFGSVARNQQSADSDIDIYYSGKPLSLFELAALKQELERILQVRVDIVRKRNSMNKLLKKRIQQEGIDVG